MFLIVGVLVLADIANLIPPTAVSGAKLRREQEEIEGDNVCFNDNNNCIIHTCVLSVLNIRLLNKCFL